MRDRERNRAVNTTAALEPQAPVNPLRSLPVNRRLHEPRSDAWERDQLTDRLRSLRRVLPVLAQEMAAARRQAAHLKVDNRRLTEQVRELRARLEAHERSAKSS